MDIYNRISKANSLQFVKIEPTDGKTTFKNEINTFSGNKDNDIPYCTKTMLQVSDTVITQVESNYSNVSAELRKSTGESWGLNIVKKTNNLGNFLGYNNVSLQDYDSKHSAISFTQGFLIDESLEVTVDPYMLNGNLPRFAEVGNSISLYDSSKTLIFNKEIKSVFYDSKSRVKVILVEKQNGVLNSTDYLASSYFDLLDYDIFEFKTKFKEKEPGTYDVVVECSEQEKETQYFQSENIDLKEFQEDTVCLRYYNDPKTDVLYRYGLKDVGGLLRVPFLQSVIENKQNSEISEDEDFSSVVDSEVYRQNRFIFDSVTGTYLRTLVLALSSENLFINNMGYVKEQEVDFEKLGRTNLYDSTVLLNQSGYTYKNKLEANIFDIDKYAYDSVNRIFSVYPEDQMYFSGKGSEPNIGDKISLDEDQDFIFNGNSKYYAINDTTWIQIDSEGLVIDKGLILEEVPFIMEVEIPSDNFEFVLTNNSGGNNSLQFGNNAVADWGDGTTDTLNDSSYEQNLSFTKTFAKAGSYQVTFTGRLNQVGFNQSPTNDTVKRITQWGDLGNLYYDFYQCHYLESIPEGAITGLLNSKRGTKFNGEATPSEVRYLFNWRDAYSLEKLPTGFTEFIKYEDTGLSISWTLNGVRTIEEIPQDWLEGLRVVNVGSFLDEAWRVKHLPINLLNNAHSITGKWGTYSLNALGRDYRSYEDITLVIDDQFFSKVEFETGRGDLFSQWNIAEIPRDILQNSLSSIQNGGTGEIDIERFCCQATKIHDLPDGIFKGFQIQSKGSQALRGTKITRLKTSWFGGTIQTNEITLNDFARDCPLTDIDVDFFNGYFPNVNNLETAFYNTDLTEIQDTLFRNLHKLKSVHAMLLRTNIETVPQDFIKESILMEDISSLFSSTPITSVPPDIFKDFSKVTKAEGVFAGSTITTIPEDLFYDMPLVESFYRLFYRCKQIEYVGEIFKNSVNVTRTEAAFQESKINTVPNTLLENCTELVDITMMFRGATSLVSGIDEDFLINNTKINSLFYAFENSKCTVLPSINHLTQMTTMERAFWRYGALSIPKDYLDGMTSLENVKYAWSTIPTIEGVIPRFWKDSTLNLTNTEGAFSYTSNAINYLEIPTSWGGTNDGSVTRLGFYIDENGYTSSNSVQNGGEVNWLVHNGANEEPSVGDTIYQDYEPSTDVFIGLDKYYAIKENKWIQISSSGEVLSKGDSTAPPLNLEVLNFGIIQPITDGVQLAINRTEGTGVVTQEISYRQVGTTNFLLGVSTTDRLTIMTQTGLISGQSYDFQLTLIDDNETVVSNIITSTPN